MSTSLATDLQDYDRRDLAESVARVLDAVRRHGDTAVSDSLEQLDAPELAQRADAIDGSVADDLRVIQCRVRDAASVQLASLRDVETEVSPGMVMGVRHTAIDSAGICLPDFQPTGTELGLAQAAVIAARAAGVRRVVACLPSAGRMASSLAEAALAIAGIDTIYRTGGIEGLAALTVGTESIPRVDIVLGVGDPGLEECCRQISASNQRGHRRGLVVIADEFADPALVAADLLVAGEADSEAQAILITTSPALAATVPTLIDRQLSTLPNIATLRCTWRRLGAIQVVDDPTEACSLADRYGLERVEVVTAQPTSFLGRLRTCQELFLGPGAGLGLVSPVANHEPVPFGGSSGLPSVATFMRAMTYRVAHEVDRAEAEAVARQCRVAGLEAHARACDLRALQSSTGCGSLRPISLD